MVGILVAIAAPPPFQANTVLTAAQLNTAFATAQITGGTIDGAQIGSFNPSTGRFSSLILQAPLATAYGGTGVANGTLNTITLTGNYPLTFTLSGVTSIALPTTGTITTLGNNGTGTGIFVFQNNATLSTPTIGNATATTLAIGATGLATAQFTQAGTFTSTTVGQGYLLQSNITAGVAFANYGVLIKPMQNLSSGGGGHSLSVQPTVTTFSSGSHPFYNSLSVYAPVLGGTAVIATATTLYVDGSPSGSLVTQARALWVAGGLTELSGPLRVATVSTPNQVQLTQTTAPTCSLSCGTTPTVVGSDSAMTVTMGTGGSPASPFTVTFNGTWTAAPACVAQAGVTSMVVGKIPMVVATVTTSLSVTTNGTAPSVKDKYHIFCFGTQ